MKRTLLVLGCLATPVPVAAQICGAFADAADHLLWHREVFEAAEWADARAGLDLETIDPGDPVELVTDTATCASLIERELEMAGLSGRTLDPGGYAIYRYGPYYAIEYRPPPRRVGDTIYHASARLVVYTVGRGQKLKGTLPPDWRGKPRRRPARVGRQPSSGASTGPPTKRSMRQVPSGARSQRRK